MAEVPVGGGDTRVGTLQLALESAGGAALFSGVAYCWISVVGGAARRERARLKAHDRAHRAHYAAVEAAEDDPSFSPDVIEQSVTDVVALANGLWQSRDPGILGDRPDAGLVRAWARWWQSWLGQGLEIGGTPSIDLISVVNRQDEGEDRIVARVRLRIHCQHPKVGAMGPHHSHPDERWTFGRRGSSWFLLSVDGDPLAGPVLTSPLVPNAASDTERLQEASFAELATAQMVDHDVVLSDLVSADAPPSFALLDLSVVDGRFLPALIAGELAHLVEAWEGAIAGSEAPLDTLASLEAAEVLLRPGPGVRLIMRDAVLQSWEATKLDLSRVPPAIEVALVVKAVRHVVSDGGKTVSGSLAEPRPMDLAWTLELTDSAEAPWRLVTSNSPAEGIPGWSPGSRRRH